MVGDFRSLIYFIGMWHLFTCNDIQRNEQFYIRSNTLEENSNSPENLLKTIQQSPSRISCALKCKNYAGCTTVYYDVSSKQCKLFQGSPKLRKQADGSEQNFFQQENLLCQRSGGEFKKNLECCQRNYGGTECRTLKKSLEKSGPASNCKEIFDTFPRFQSSVYWIQGLTESEEMYCDKISENEINNGTATDVMTCSNADEDKRFKHPAGKCRYYIKCSRNQAWLVKCSETSNGKFTFYSVAEKRCLKTEKCYEYQKDGVCYGAKDDSFGTFTLTETGYITKVRLVHQSGYLTTLRNYPTTSIWGDPVNQKIGTVITDASNTVLFGSLDFYVLDDYNEQSPYLVLPNETTVYVNKGDVFRVWYSEDIRKDAEGNNDGTHCMAVFAMFVN